MSQILQNLQIMSNWLIPCNSDVFRIHDYFAKNCIVDWKQSHYKFMVGDIVYIYCSMPEMKIRYKCRVVLPNIEYSESINDEEYWTDKHISEAVAKQNRYVRMELIDALDSSELTLHTLMPYGLKKAPQGPQRIQGDLLLYIQSVFNK